MAHLNALLAPPTAGGDSVDWADIERTTGLRFPTDYRAFVESYGGGEIDDHLAISTPPVAGSPYGDLLDGSNPALRDQDREELRLLLPGEPLPSLVPFAAAGSDIALWVCEGVPDDWRVVVYRRQTPWGESSWTLFDGGMVSFVVALLTGALGGAFSDSPPADMPHSFRSWRAA
ncbi:SMI1/KNR4 family protein [Streptomyces sp. NPDC048290]|uniref:SMI1/KNR4 family protein n=1 Tax=Streptomyces sp. NPDC048290 TaxID=3155811 RepID=UPI00344A914B